MTYSLNSLLWSFGNDVAKRLSSQEFVCSINPRDTSVDCSPTNRCVSKFRHDFFGKYVHRVRHLLLAQTAISEKQDHISQIRQKLLMTRNQANTRLRDTKRTFQVGVRGRIYHFFWFGQFQQLLPRCREDRKIFALACSSVPAR